jgi:hypothetical protein
MRAAIKTALEQNTSITTWLPPFADLAGVEAPFGIVSFGEMTRNIVHGRSRWQDVTLWIYASTFLEGDTLAKEVKQALLTNKEPKELTTADGRRFVLLWNQDSRDYLDPDLNLVVKRIDYSIPLGG